MARYLTTALLALALLVSFKASASIAHTDLPTSHAQSSEYVISYDDWNLILSATVLDTGLSDRRPASRKLSRGTASRIRHGNTSATSVEGNRVMFFEFEPAHIDSLLAIRKDLEAVPSFMPLERFSKNEQLAYWLNVHNVAVMLEVAREYPLKKVKKLAIGKRSVWDKKNMSIDGVATSIKDIEDHVTENWDNPLVIYGFFMGAVGGPNIRSEAFTGKNVMAALKKNAYEFINSLRGFRLWAGKGRVSDHYNVGRRYFPDFEQDIKSHMLAFARADTRRDLEKAKSFATKNYDWGIADLKDGDIYAGSSFNTNSGALSWFLTETPTAPSVSFKLKATARDKFVASIQTSRGAPGDSAFGTNAFNHGSSQISPQTKALLRAIKMRNARRQRRGEVTVEEFIDGEGARIQKEETDDSGES